GKIDQSRVSDQGILYDLTGKLLNATIFRQSEITTSITDGKITKGIVYEQVILKDGKIDQSRVSDQGILYDLTGKLLNATIFRQSEITTSITDGNITKGIVYEQVIVKDGKIDPKAIGQGILYDIKGKLYSGNLIQMTSGLPVGVYSEVKDGKVVSKTNVIIDKGKVIFAVKENLGKSLTSVLNGRKWVFSVEKDSGTKEYFIQAKVDCSRSPITSAVDGKKLSFSKTLNADGTTSSSISLRLTGDGIWQTLDSMITTTNEKLKVVDKSGKVIQLATGAYILDKNSMIRLTASGSMNIISGTLTLTGSASLKTSSVNTVESQKSSQGTSPKAQTIHVTGTGVLYDGTIGIENDSAIARENQTFILGTGASIKIDKKIYTSDSIASQWKNLKLKVGALGVKLGASDNAIAIVGGKVVLNAIRMNAVDWTANTGVNGKNSLIKVLETAMSSLRGKETGKDPVTGASVNLKASIQSLINLVKNDQIDYTTAKKIVSRLTRAEDAIAISMIAAGMPMPVAPGKLSGLTYEFAKASSFMLASHGLKDGFNITDAKTQLKSMLIEAIGLMKIAAAEEAARPLRYDYAHNELKRYQLALAKLDEPGSSLTDVIRMVSNNLLQKKFGYILSRSRIERVDVGKELGIGKGISDGSYEGVVNLGLVDKYNTAMLDGDIESAATIAASREQQMSAITVWAWSMGSKEQMSG
ncbi:MAG: hypothetical protein KJ584_05225, partial [Candidatus Omnitrophica bacterium]|nr:hypothetical protein [Candidatus Omnitrophota bacterium]